MKVVDAKVDAINEEFRRLHEHTTRLQSDVAQGLSRERFLQDQIDKLQGEAITLKEQMTKDFATICQQRFQIGSLTKRIEDLTDSLSDYQNMIKPGNNTHE